MPIRITNFGGIVPKASPRALPDNGAQRAQDLQPDIQEFRPLQTDTVVVASSGVSNPKTIHRLARKADGSFNIDMTTGWIVKAGEMSFVKAQINDDTTERTYATFDDGSAPPRVYDATDLVTGRLLGVPSPSSAPTATVNVNDEFTTEERSASIQAAQTYMRNIVAVAMQPLFRGSPSDDPVDYRPGLTTDGWVDRDYIPGLDPEEAQQLRVFRLGSTGGANNGALSNTYATDGVDHYQWALDPALGGFYQTSPASGWPSWAGINQDHWCLPVYAYGLTFIVNQADLKTRLMLMEMPGVSPAAPLMTEEQADTIVANVVDIADQQLDEVTPLLNAIKAEMATMHSLLGGGGTAQRTAALTAFYAKSDVVAEIGSAVDNAAEAFWNLAVRANQQQPFTGFS
jgi:hypothetical protein